MFLAIHDDFYKNLIRSDEKNISNNEQDNSIILKLLLNNNENFDNVNFDIFKKKFINTVNINGEGTSEKVNIESPEHANLKSDEVI